jgi:hypothetical protein
MDEKRYCGHCRQEIDAGAARCPHCGGELPSPTPAPAAILSAAAPAPRDGSGPAATPPSSRLSTNGSRGEGAPLQDPPPPSSEEPPAPSLKRSGETVGDLATVRSPGDELTLSWSEGMVIAERFRVVRCIGQGGMGMVYLAQDQMLDRSIALKRVPQEILFDGDARDDLRQEANRLLDLAHENIIRVHTYYDEPAWPFFAMEYLQGPTLKELLRTRKLEGRTFTSAEVLAVARQVERGLTYAHGKGIIHRDLKPGNLMFAAPPSAELGERDVIKITDFGISRVVADSTMRQTGKRSGTLPYMSPEQFRGESASVQSDVYSLAATYYELLCGKPPFYTGDIGYQIVHIGPRPLSGVPKHLADAILRGLQKNPRHRPASVKELTEAMEGNAPSAIQVLARRTRRPARLAGLAALFLFAAWLVIYGMKSWEHSAAGGDAGADPLQGSGRPLAEGVKPEGLFEPLALVRSAREIQTQLDGAGLRTAISRTPFRFTLRKRLPDLSNEILKRVQFLISSPDSPGEQRISGREPSKDGVVLPDVFEFEIEDLPEGDYVLRTVLFDLQFPKNAPDKRSFRVDLTGPAFELGPTNREELIEIDERWFVTYNEETDLALSTPLAPGDIDKAYYQIYVDSLGRYGDRQKIADPARWQVTLVPGRNQFQVVAADELGNETTRALRIDRLELEVVKFEIDRMAGGVVGNRAAVRGELKIEKVKVKEGRVKVPVLRYLVNEQLVAPEQVTEPTTESSIFKAVLTLPRHTNTIEVRYQWGDDIPRPFAVASDARLSQEVPAPRLDLVPVPPQTNKTGIDIAGRLSPYFDGLEVHLLHEQMGSYRLQLKPSRGGADFLERKQLVENRLNRFTFTCTYGGQVLRPDGPTLEVYCDLTPPRLLDPVEFKPQGEFVQIIITPSEDPLASLTMLGPDGEWRLIPPRNDGRYRALVPLPRDKAEFQFKMVDLAGNEQVVRQTCPIFDAAALASGPEPEGKAQPAGVREGEAAAAPAVARRNVRSSLLKELDLDFAPFGIFEEEMGTTEVNQKAWNCFLRDRLQPKSPVPEGDPRLPMTIDERFDQNLLILFAIWITEKSDDGYRYSVPTANQWMQAFTGSRDPREAAEAIRRWFRGEDLKKRFFPSPRVRYGVNSVSRIGERAENRTPTGLLDMESNLQEIVQDENRLWYVIGGYNTLRESDLPWACTEKRFYNTGTENWAGKFTGFRLVRKPEKRE